MDFIFIRDMTAEATVGIYSHERSRPQSLQLNLEIAMPGNTAFSSDLIGDTIDYAAVVDAIRQMLAQRRFSLMETLAESVASLVIEQFDAPLVRVDAAKGPVLPDVRQVGIVIERVRHAAPAILRPERERADGLSEAA